MSEETYLDRIKANSTIAGLFNPDMKGENLAEGINARISLASPLLDSALRAARSGRDNGAHVCTCCHDSVDLLEAYKAIIRLTLDAAETEQMRRGKGKAA
jgi:hypothetical protein